LAIYLINYVRTKCSK